MTGFDPEPWRNRPTAEQQAALFEREVDDFCRFATIRRPRCREWVEFSRRFVPFCFEWNGCWVAEEAVNEWRLYVSLPEGEYEPLDYPPDFDFYRRGKT